MKPRDRVTSKGLLPRMEARPRKDGQVTYRFHPLGGKPITLGTDRGQAIQKVLDLNGRASDAGTFKELWRIHQQTNKWKRLADSTKAFYLECWGREPGTKGPDDKGAGLARVWANGVVVRARPMDVAKYLTVERADAPIVANREVSLLSNLFKLAVSRGDIDRNPCKEVSRNPEEPRTRSVEVGELATFVTWALEQGPSAVVVCSMAEFAALSGNRRIEFRTLYWPQVDEVIIRLNRAKQRGTNKKRELIERSEAIDRVLARMKAGKHYTPMGPVFPAPRTGNPYQETGFATMWNRLMADALTAGIVTERFTFHDLRAYYTTEFKRRFGGLPELHADPGTTAKTYERSREVRRKAL